MKVEIKMKKKYDKIIIGAGLYGLYADAFCMERGQHVLVLEYEDAGVFQAFRGGFRFLYP